MVLVSHDFLAPAVCKALFLDFLPSAGFFSTSLSMLPPPLPPLLIPPTFESWHILRSHSQLPSLPSLYAHSCSYSLLVSPKALSPAQICYLSSRPLIPNASAFQCRCFISLFSYSICPKMISLLPSLVPCYSHPNSEQHHSALWSKSENHGHPVLFFLHPPVFTSRSC